MNREVINGIAIGNLATFSYAASKGPTRTGNNPQGNALNAQRGTRTNSVPVTGAQLGRSPATAVDTKAQCEIYRTVSQTQSSWERFGVTAPFIS